MSGEGGMKSFGILSQPLLGFCPQGKDVCVGVESRVGVRVGLMGNDCRDVGVSNDVFKRVASCCKCGGIGGYGRV